MKNFELMPDHARVWIYTANRFFSESEVDSITLLTEKFVEQWSSHATSMNASFTILYNRILVIAADEEEAKASGCGIDKSVHFVKELGVSLGIDFFQRTTVIFQIGDLWEEAPVHQFWAKRKANLINDETRVIDTTVTSVGQLRSEIVKPFRASWHAEMWGR